MARIPDEELERIKSQVRVEDLCRDYGIELARMAPQMTRKAADQSWLGAVLIDDLFED